MTSSLNDNQSKELQQLIEQTKEGARVFQSSLFTRYLSHIYLNTHLQPKLFYPLTSSSLTNVYCQQVEKSTSIMLSPILVTVVNDRYPCDIFPTVIED